MREAVILNALRTPIGRYMGALKEVPGYDLSVLVLNEVLKRAEIYVQEVDKMLSGQSHQS
ncbi:MAG: hypothetical protein ACUVQ9_05250 [Thermodesulfobacteriota bacterium]